VRIDRWGAHAVITLDSPSLKSLVEPIADWCVARLGVAGVHLALRRDPRDTDTGSDLQLGPIRGADPGEIEVRERGLAYGVRPAEAPDVGLYADMREVRAWLEPHWKGRRMLNLFAFTGAFTVSALAHGAAAATTVDLSQGVLQRAAANVAKNGLQSPPESFVAEDSFKALDRMRRKNERYDVVVCDPPSFSRTPDGQVWSAAKDIPRLAAACCRVLDPDGWLVFASNSGELSPHAFRGEVDEGIRKADRVGQELFFGGQGPDFPVATTFPEGRYLKVGVWRLS
jgi:23S rRNA (cytosine1962-C5)-methyltransferase